MTTKGRNLSAALTLALAIVCVSLPSAHAQTAPTARVYNVEVIVFRNNSGAGGPEDWNARPVARGPDTPEAPVTGKFVQSVPAAQFQLKDVARRLQNSANYQPIAHFAWQQTASSWGSRAGFTVAKLAEADALRDQEVVSTQAGRLLSSDRADTVLIRFFREWTQTSMLSAGDKSEALFPDFDDALAASMGQSFDRWVVDAVRRDGSLSDLLSSDDAWVDERLAAFLSVPPPERGFERVQLDATRRGLLTQPAWLASLAHSDDTSFVFRGRFVQKRLLCNEFGPPPPNAMSVEFDLPDDPTAPERSEAVRANANCASCHNLMDPIGLAFESFDAIGRHREGDAGGRPIDPSGVLVGASTPSIELHPFAMNPTMRASAA
jgi:hypothetical protein